MSTKKIISVLIAVMLILGMMTISAFAETKVTLTASAASPSVKIGSEFKVDFKAVGVVAMSSFTVTYDDEILTFDQSKSTFGQSFVFKGDTDGTIVVEYQSTAATTFSAADTMFSLGFTACDEATFNAKAGNNTSLETEVTIYPTWSEDDGLYVITGAGFVYYDISEVACNDLTVNIVKSHETPTFDLAISGDAVAGKELSANITNFVDNWGLTPSYTYKWKAGTEEIGTGDKYTLTAAEIGKTISLEVTATVQADENNTVTKTATMSGAVTADPTAKASVTGLTVAGTLKVGKVLTVTYTFVPSVNGGNDASAIKWYAVSGDTETEIAGATAAVYKLTKNEKDCQIKVVVTPKGSLDTATGDEVEFTTAIVEGSSTKGSPTGGNGTLLPGVGKEEPGKEEPGKEEPGKEEPKKSADKFTDFSKTTYSWAYDAVDKLVKEGVIEGKDEKTFDPEGTTTNAEFVAMVIRAMGVETSPVAGGDHWAKNIIAAAKEKGLLDYTDSFEADTAITREEMFTVLYKALLASGKTLEKGEVSSFTDAASISDFAKEATGALIKAGIVNGMGDGTVAPKGTATRAQVAAVIFRAFFK